jgi:DNA-binding Lrp family transcriptional regulator
MADACWGGGDVYAVVESDDWKDLNEVVLNQIHRMPGVTRTETHVAIVA